MRAVTIWSSWRATPKRTMQMDGSDPAAMDALFDGLKGPYRVAINKPSRSIGSSNGPRQRWCALMRFGPVLPLTRIDGQFHIELDHRVCRAFHHPFGNADQIVRRAGIDLEQQFIVHL